MEDKRTGIEEAADMVAEALGIDPEKVSIDSDGVCLTQAQARRLAVLAKKGKTA